MAFSQSSITSDPVCRFYGSEIEVSWESSAPAGTIYQLYIGGVLSYSGTNRYFHTPYIEPGSEIQVGTVGAGESKTDFSGSLTPIAGRKRRPNLAWYGGRYLDVDLAGYRIYASPTAGSPVGAEPISTVVAVENGRWEDGFGMGRFGKGGFGFAEIAYHWTGSPLGNGTWNFEIRGYDAAGNEGLAESASLVIEAAPEPPTLIAEGVRMMYDYDSTAGVATLSWLPSPG